MGRLLVVFVLLLAGACFSDPTVILSPPYAIEKKYKSMMGPQSTQSIRVGGRPGELKWIVGYSAQMVNESGTQVLSQEFMCHSNLDVNAERHARLMGVHRRASGRLFTLSQGQESIEFPPGFGIPVKSEEALSLTTQVLNLNHENPSLRVRHKVTLHLAEGGPGMRALYETAVYVRRLLKPEDCDRETRSTGVCCLPARPASYSRYMDEKGRPTIGHWVVKPGREVSTTDVTLMLNLKSDTRAHYIAVHLHPYAESLELIDKTTGRSVFKAMAVNSPSRIGLDRVDFLSSVEGVPLYRGHRYELVSTYNNTTSEDQDAMAGMYLYLEDRELNYRLQK